MEFQFAKGRIYIEDETGKLLAEVTFPDLDNETVIINHTFVDDSLRGQKIAAKLMEAIVEYLENSGKKAALTCSYAQEYFKKNPQLQKFLK